MEPHSERATGMDEARRDFLARCGKLAVATPPAVTLLLAASERHYAVAQSAGVGGGGAGAGGGGNPGQGPQGNQGRGPQGNNGFGNGGGDGVPGRSGQSDLQR